MIPIEIQDKIFKNLLSIEETVEFFSKDYDYSKDLIELLEKALYDLNPEAIEILLYASSCNGQLDSHFTSIMTKLLLEPKILNHNVESVIESLQYIKDPATVGSLYDACIDYPFSDEHSIPIKAMWALRDIGTSEALDKIRILASNDDNRISAIAKQQLEYLEQKEEST